MRMEKSFEMIETIIQSQTGIYASPLRRFTRCSVFTQMFSSFSDILSLFVHLIVVVFVYRKFMCLLKTTKTRNGKHFGKAPSTPSPFPYTCAVCYWNVRLAFSLWLSRIVKRSAKKRHRNIANERLGEKTSEIKKNDLMWKSISNLKDK